MGRSILQSERSVCDPLPQKGPEVRVANTSYRQISEVQSLCPAHKTRSDRSDQIRSDGMGWGGMGWDRMGWDRIG